MKQFLNQLAVPHGDWTALFSACLGKMISIQQACAEYVVKNEDWNVDLERGVISFGTREYPLQFIGSESASSGTWLWGWENINDFPEKIIRLARETREFGAAQQIEALTTDEFDLNDTYNGHNLSIVTCGLADGYAYYRCPHNGGAFFVGLSDVPDAVFDPVDFPRFVSVVTQCIEQFALDHRIFAEAFLLWNRTPYEADGDALIAHFAQDLRIEFERAGDDLRIASIATL